MTALTVRAAAEADVDEIARTIAVDNLGAAIRFYDAVESTYSIIAAFPNIGTRRTTTDPLLTGLRSFGVRGYRNYLVFFIPRADHIDILRLMHAARDHDRWLRANEP